MDKNEVIQITLNLIKEKKLEGASVGEIIKIMNTSAGSLYYYFKSKNEIYEKIGLPPTKRGNPPLRNKYSKNS